MAKVKLEQENGEMSSMIKILMSANDTNLMKVCYEHKLNYSSTDKRIRAKKVDLAFLKDLIGKIDPKAKFSVDVNISLTANGKEIFNQKTEK
jgi:hypothetical protein